MAANFTAHTHLLHPCREAAPAGLWKASVQRVRLIPGSCAIAAHIRPSSCNWPFEAKMFSWLSKKPSGPRALASAPPGLGSCAEQSALHLCERRADGHVGLVRRSAGIDAFGQGVQSHAPF